MSKVFKIFVILLMSSGIKAQEINFFTGVPYAKSFVSDIRSPLTKLEIGFPNKVADEYYIKNISGRPFIEAHFGYEIPVFSYSKNNLGLYFGLPGGSVTLVDMFEATTAPVINTDYWFGTEVKMIKRFNKNHIKNITFNTMPLFHESTHIGDEFALHGYKNINNFKRINISYEAWKFSVTLNDPDTLKGNVLSLKTGIQGLWLPEYGYYFTDSLETKGIEIPLSSKTFEWYFSLNYQRTEGFLSSEKIVNILSAEINNRPQFSYDTNIEEARIWSYNLYFGWKVRPSNKPYQNIGFFLRHYGGLNPHGQFRNQSGYRFTGISLVLM